MAKELTDILKAAAEVRDETALQQNTATRVGGVLTDLANFVGEAVFAAGMTAKTNTAGVSLLIKYYDADGQPYTKELPLPVVSLQRAGVITPAQLADLNTADRNETTARQASDAELLRRLQGNSTSSSAYSDPCINLGGFEHLYADDGTTIVKHAVIMAQEALEAKLQGTMQDVTKYIGEMRGQIYGIPFEAWNFVQRWPTIQQSSIYVQVLHSNFPADTRGDLKEQDDNLHTLCRTVNVYLDADGNFDHSQAGPWRECSLQETDRNNLAAFAYLGAFASMDYAGAKAATVPYAGNADFVLLRFRIGDKGGLILQNVNGASTEQYLFYSGKRYVRYVDFTSADRTAVKTVQAWKLDGVAYIFYDATNRIIYQRNQWDENISGGGPSTLPLASATYAGMLSNTAFTHLSNFNIYEHSVPTTNTVSLVFTKPLTGETITATLAAATSARAGVMTANQVTRLSNAMQRWEVGYFSAAEYFNEGTNAVPENQSTTSSTGTVVFCNRIGLSPGASFTYAGFLYKVGTKYYTAVPGSFGKPMPRPESIAINTSDGCAYVLNADGALVKFIPVATTDIPGLMPSSAYSKLNTLTQQAENIHLINLGTFDNSSDAENAAAQLNICSNPIFRHIFYTVGANSFHITQQIENDYCIQTLFLGKAIKQRYIRFSSADRTNIAETQTWQQAMVRNLKYNAANQQLQLQSPWNDNVGSPATIPTVSSSANGLAPKEWIARFTGIEANIAAHYEEIQNHLNAIYARLSVIENKIEAYHPSSTQP